MRRFAIAGLFGVLLVSLSSAAAGQVPPPAEVRLWVQMPLATNAVVELGVPAPRVERTVVLLNQHQVPVVESVEILRYTPFPLVVERYVVPEPAVIETRWDLATLDMPVLLEARLGEGLTGRALASAVLVDLRELGFPVETRQQAIVTLPPPRDPAFVVFVQPGFRFEQRGVFHDRVIVVEEHHFAPRDRRGPPPHARGWGPPPHARGKGPPETVPPPHARGKGPPQAAPPPGRGKGPPQAAPHPGRGKGPPQATPPSRSQGPPHAGPPPSRGKGPPAKRPPGHAGGQERREGPPGQARRQGPRDSSPQGQGRGRGGPPQRGRS